jgi:hypothetical protein
VATSLIIPKLKLFSPLSFTRALNEILISSKSYLFYTHKKNLNIYFITDKYNNDSLTSAVLGKLSFIGYYKPS